MKKIRNINIYFIIIMLLELIVPIILSLILKRINLRDIRVLLFLNHFVCFIVPAALYMIITKSNPKKVLRLNKLPLRSFGIIVLIAFVSQPIMASCSAITSLFFQNNVASVFEQLKSTPAIVLFLLIAVMPAITEEITLRGVVLSGYNGTTDFKAALLNGLLFGIFHLDAQQFLYAFVLGFILAYVVRVTNSIFSSMSIHFLINATSVAVQLIAIRFSENIQQSQNNVVMSTLPIAQKVLIIVGALCITAFFASIIFLLIRVLKSWHSEAEPVVIRTNSSETTVEKERVINIPLFIIIAIYITIMTLILNGII